MNKQIYTYAFLGLLLVPTAWAGYVYPITLLVLILAYFFNKYLEKKEASSEADNIDLEILNQGLKAELAENRIEINNVKEELTRITSRLKALEDKAGIFAFAKVTVSR